MIMLAIDWGFAGLITAVGIGVTFLLLIVLIWVMKKNAAKPAVTTDMHPTPHEQAAIAMAMHLYFDAHDEEPHIITIQEVERRYSPWSSKIYNVRNGVIK